MSSLSYIERNRGVVTASKLKTFIKSPEAYFKQYIQEVSIDKETSRAFTLGTAFDDALSYGAIEWNKKYFVDDGLTVAELVEKCFSIGIAPTGKEKKDELLRMAYGDIDSKIRLTASEGESIRGMLSEATRQPLWDIHGDYEKQAVIEGMYKWKLKLRGTLDRLSTEKGMIRDWKTTSALRNFTFELSGKYGYEISMAFYYALVKMIRGVDCDVYLDVVQSSWVYQSEVFCYQKERMHTVLIDTIIPALDKLLEMTTQWEETKDESIWKVQPANRYELFDLETYPILETGLQQTISYI